LEHGDLARAHSSGVERHVLAFDTHRLLGREHERLAALIRRVIDLLDERAEIVAEAMTREMGKALKDARAEVARSRETELKDITPIRFRKKARD
jgi:acyl-CoA reductase-like NAD-dependent aldehyde dehydrogenase